MSRRHNNSNILVMGGRVIGEELAREIVRAWLETPFDGGRHQLRIKAKYHACNFENGTNIQTTLKAWLEILYELSTLYFLCACLRAVTHKFSSVGCYF
jgi:hypothetical protein